VNEVYQKIIAELSGVVIGKDDLKKALMLALVADGHLLIEGVVGSGKTTLARSFAETIGGVFKRIQFTPDCVSPALMAQNRDGHS
jgi:MoxR-like ATPase